MKFFQIQVSDGLIYGLDGDGKIWVGRAENKYGALNFSEMAWRKVPMPDETLLNLKKGADEQGRYS